VHIREGRAPIRGIIIIRDYRPPSHIYPPRRVVVSIYSIHVKYMLEVYIYVCMCIIYNIYADNNRVGQTLRWIERIPRGCGIVHII